MLCHRVLRRVQDVAKESQILERETWESLLGFLLASNDALLSPPTVKGSILQKSGLAVCTKIIDLFFDTSLKTPELT